MKAASRARISRAALSDLLADIVKSQFGAERRISRWSRRMSAYSSSCRIVNLRVCLDNGEACSLVWKSLETESWLPTAQDIRPTFLYDPRREILVYRSILQDLADDTPRYMGSVIDPVNQRYWLVTERVQAPLLWQLGQVRHWLAAARWLARFHLAGASVGFGEGKGAGMGLLDYDEHHFQQWPLRAERFLSDDDTPLGNGFMRRFLKLLDRYDRVIHTLTELPITLVHGEFYPSNVLMRRCDRQHRVCPIDWELTGRGPGILDLAALTFGGWREEKKREMIKAYHEVIASDERSCVTYKELCDLVDHAHLHLCMRQLGWARGWKTPTQHSRDWVRDAMLLAGKLGLVN